MENKLILERAFINGEWVQTSDTFEVRNPATGTVIAEVADCQTEDIERAIITAEAAWKSWKKNTAEERSNLLEKWYQLILENKSDLAQIISLECGKPLKESLGEVDYGASFIKWFAEEGKRSYGESVPSSNINNRIITTKESVGVVAAITPWNFPLAMLTRKMGPALAAGCTIVLKPASETPLTALALAKLSEYAGFPAGILNIVCSPRSSEIGFTLSTHPLIRKISFTGSTKVGSLLMKQAAGTVKKISFELGGNAPFLVFDDADLDAAVQGALVAKFRNSGQTCIAANRFLIQEKIYEEFAAKLTSAVKKLKTGNGLEEGVDVGPLINESGLKKVKEHVEDAVKKGAEIRTGGRSIGGLFYEPTVLSGVNTHNRIAKEETFGPVVSLFRFKEEEEGIQLANDTEFGLAAYLYSRDLKRCIRISESIEAGMIGINTGMISTASAPFGGIKQSGIGREGSKHGLDEYMELKYHCIGL